ncbi:MAG: endonuclease [Bacteroidales bacterium]|nr:endonuclease [Bacteroidales bacterium]
MLKKTTMISLVLTLISAFTLNAQNTDAYYQNAFGKKGYELQKALCQIITDGSFVIDYGSTDAARHIDVTPEGYIYDIYSYPCCNISHFGTATNEQCTKYSFEHLFCQSWFNPDSVYNINAPNPFPICSDLHHLFPTDHYVNSSYHNNAPYGEVVAPRKIAQNGTQWGYANFNCFADSAICSKPVFEPAKEFKGDIARALLYVSIRYMLIDENFAPETDMTYRSQFKPWALEMLKKWAALDPVSDKERARNEKIYTYYQFNRNPLIDHPELIELIWGTDSLYNTFGNTSPDDAKRPVAISASCSDNQIFLVFSKKLDIESAEDIANYSITKGICIESATCTDSIVTLTIDGKLTHNTRYFVYCSGVKSADGYHVKATSTPFTHGGYNSWYSCSGPREVLAAWTFDNYSVELPLRIKAGAEIGVSEIFNSAYIYGDSTHGSSLFDSLEVKSIAGNLAGDPRAAAKADKALNLKKKSANGKSIVIAFPTKNWQEIMVTLATKRTSTGFKTHTWEWSLDGESYSPLAVENTIGDWGSVHSTDYFWMRQIDLREISEINDQDSVFLRLTIDGATGSGTNTFDNIVVYGEQKGFIPGTTSVTEQPAQDFVVYPNPNNGQFEIACAESSEFTDLQVFDMSGRMIMSQTINDKVFSVSMNDKPAGLYFVKMIDRKNAKSLVKKIVVSK